MDTSRLVTGKNTSVFCPRKRHMPTASTHPEFERLEAAAQVLEEIHGIVIANGDRPAKLTDVDTERIWEDR